MTEATPPSVPAAPAARWQPLPALERRLLGVLMEKAKTTPDGYPMTINALVIGANQKSNRYPLMNVEAEEVELALVRLREVGAVSEIHGSGRVAKYRHHFYEWFNVTGVESAVLTELLLRGAQTEGELRGRAARMEPIADLPALRPVLESLAAKKLILSLTPAGRGHVVTHALYSERELDKLRAQFSAPARNEPAEDDDAETPVRTSRGAEPESPSLRAEVAELRALVEQLRDELQQLKSSLGV